MKKLIIAFLILTNALYAIGQSNIQPIGTKDNTVKILNNLQIVGWLAPGQFSDTPINVTGFPVGSIIIRHADSIPYAYNGKLGSVQKWVRIGGGNSVTTVNGQTGTVTIFIPTDNAQLTNGSNFITAAQAPVLSVNGITGAVTVDGTVTHLNAGANISLAGLGTIASPYIITGNLLPGGRNADTIRGSPMDTTGKAQNFAIVFDTTGIAAGGRGTWKVRAISTTYSGLTDVQLTSLANNQVMQYNNSLSKWVNIVAPWITTITGIGAGGDLSGTFPNPTVAKLNGLAASYYLDYTNLINKPGPFQLLATQTMANLSTYNVTGLSDSSIINVSGFYTPLDGGGGLFQYVSTSTATPVKGVVILPSAGPGRLIRMVSGSIMEGSWFGIRNDGTTFDSTTVQLSFDYCGSVGKSLRLPSGTVIMRNIFFNYDNFTLLGSGTSILKAPVTDTTANAAIINCAGRHNIKIMGVDFDGSQMKGSQAGGNPVIRLSTDTNVVLSNFNIYGNAYTGVSIQNFCYNVDIGWFNIYNTDVSIHCIGNGTGSSKIRIHNGLISGGTSEGITFQGFGGTPPSASNDIIISNVHVTGKTNSSGIYFLYCYNVVMSDVEIDHCRAGIGGIPMANRPDMTHDITLTNIVIHDVINDGIGNLGRNFNATNITLKNIGREAIAVGNTLDTLHIDSNVNISHVTVDSCNTGGSPNWGVLRIQNCYNCTFDHITATIGPTKDTTGTFGIKFIGNADSIVTISNCTFKDGQVLTASNKSDNYIVFKDNFFRAINLGWAVTDSSTKKAVYINNTYTGNPAKAVSVNANGFATGINSSIPQVDYLVGNNLHIRTLEGTFIGRRIRLVSTANGNTIIHTRPGAAGNLHLRFYQDALLDSARYMDVVWDGTFWNQIDGNAVVNSWSVGADTVSINDTSLTKPKVDIVTGKGILIGGDAQLDNIRSANTNKEFRLWMPAYADPKRWIGIMSGVAGSTTNSLTIGGVTPNFDYNLQNIDFSVAPYGSIGVNPIMRLSYPDNSLHIGSVNFTGPLNLSTRQTFPDASGNAYIIWTRGKHSSPSGSTETYSGLWLNDTINNVGNGMSSGAHINPTITLANGGYAGAWFDYTSGWNFYSPSTNVPGWSAGGIRMGASNSTGHPSAQLDGNGTDKTKGWLPNTLTGAQMNAITSPASGLLVICSDSGFAICYYDGAAWRRSGYGLTGGGGGGSDSGIIAGVGIAISRLGPATRIVGVDTGSVIASLAQLKKKADSLGLLLGQKQDTSVRFNLYFRAKGGPGDTSYVYGRDSSVYVRAKRDSLGFHHAVLPDSSEVDWSLDSTGANALASKYDVDTMRLRLGAGGGGGGISSVKSSKSVTGTGVIGDSVRLVNDVSTPGKGTAYMTRPAGDSAKGYYELEENFLGTIYDSSAWANIGGFINRGASATFSATSGNLVFSGGANTFTQTAEIPYVSMLDNVTVEGGAIVGSSSANGTDGFGFGKRTVNPYGGAGFIIRFVTGTGTGTGTLQLWGGTTNAIMQTSPTALTYSSGDSIFVSGTRDGFTLTGYARNVTKNSQPIYVSFLYSANPVGDPLLDNTGRYAIYSFGGGFSVYAFKVSSKVSKNARLMILGDSKMQGYAVTAQQYRLSDQLNAYYRSTINVAGGYDRTVEYSAHNQEDLNLRPQQVLVCGASNDPRSGITSTITNTRYDSIVTSFENAKSAVFHFLPFHEGTANDQSGLRAHILATYPASRIIDGDPVTKRAGSLAPDSIHLLNYADSNLTKAVTGSGLIYAGNTRYGGNSSASSNPASGTGTVNTIPKVVSTAPYTLGNSTISDNGTRVSTTESIEAVNAGFAFNNTAAATDTKIWNNYVDVTHLYQATTNDARTTNVNYIQYNRPTGNAVTSIQPLVPVIISNTSGIPISLPAIASQPSISITGTLGAAFMNPLLANLSADQGMSISLKNQSAVSTAYNNINIITAGTTGANPTISFYNNTTARYWVAGQQISSGNYIIGTNGAFFSDFPGVNPLRLTPTGNALFTTTTDSASTIHIGAGTATQAPLKFTAGPVLTTPKNGVVEFDGAHYYGTAAGTRTQLDNAGSSTPFADNVALVKNNSDNTKLAIFSAVNISTATTRTYTLPDVNGILATINNANTWTGAQNMTGATVTVSSQAAHDSSANAASTKYVDQAVGNAYSEKLIYGDVLNSTISNSTTETTLISSFGFNTGSTTIPANFLTTGKILRYKITGTYGTNTVTPGNLTIRIKIGGATIATAVISNLVGSVSGATYTITGNIFVSNVSGTSTNCWTDGIISYGTGSALSARDVADLNNGAGATSINTTVSNPFDITAQWATASSLNVITGLICTLETQN